MKKIIINNTALRNNGDVALVDSLSGALKCRGYDVVLATSTPEAAKKNFPTINLCPDVFGYKWGLFKKEVFSDVSALFLLIVNRHYRSADIIIGAPGGYINSFYGFAWKLKIYKWSNLFGKRTAIYSQSVGPFGEKDEIEFRKSASYMSRLVVRDHASYNKSVVSGFDPSKIILSDDAIFLTDFKLSALSGNSKKVLFSVREWRYENRSQDAYLSIIKSLVREVVARGYTVEFVSTCQGIDGYVDDSNLAKRIAEGLASENINVKVNRAFLSLSDLKKVIGSSCFVVGTRLHMCLLGITSGIPAFNISYEEKGTECYKTLQMSAYSIDYNESLMSASTKFIRFLDDIHCLRERIPLVVNERKKIAHECLDTFLYDVGARDDFKNN